ncbi:MAG: hypothetical protein LBG96_10780 [Tannerella sp.]|jgi:uncharacterized membrane protein YvbJ|nr:hypothetical protein [Tannerella sp.]
MIDKNFLRLYKESTAFKDAGMLKSALAKREAATERMKHDKGHYALGKANEAILLGYHIGDGIAAFAAAKKALQHIEAFRAAAKEWEEEIGCTVLNDIFNIIRQWSASYEECEELNRMRVQWTGTDKAKQDLASIEDRHRKEPQWWKTQLSIAYDYYSRERPEMDRGLYAQGMSVLQCIVGRSFAEEPGYELDYDTHVHLLDDYIIISLKHFRNVLSKYQAKAGQYTTPDDSEEMLIVLEKALQIWTDFAPLLEAKDKALFTDYFVDYWLTLAMIHKESRMNPIARYLPEAMTDCPVCGRQIAQGSPICRYCGKITGMFPRALKNQQMPKFNLNDIPRETGIAEKKRPKSSLGCIMAIIIMIITGIIAAIKFLN